MRFDLTPIVDKNWGRKKLGQLRKAFTEFLKTQTHCFYFQMTMDLRLSESETLLSCFDYFPIWLLVNNPRLDQFETLSVGIKGKIFYENHKFLVKFQTGLYKLVTDTLKVFGDQSRFICQDID